MRWKELKTRKEIKHWFKRRAIDYVWEQYLKECGGNVLIKKE